MSFDSVLVFGDSTAAGAELLLPNETWSTGLIKSRSFGNQLANKLNIPCYNYALGGGSNTRSLRLLPKALLTHPNSLVLFCYTFFHTRTEFFLEEYSIPETIEPDGNSDYTSYIAFLSNWQENKRIGTAYTKLSKLWLKYFVSPNHGRLSTDELCNTLFTVQTLCEKYASRLVHIPLYQCEIPVSVEKNEVWKFIKKSNFFPFWDFHQLEELDDLDNHGIGSLVKWAEKNNYSFCSGGHIGQEAHDKFALELYNIYK